MPKIEKIGQDVLDSEPRQTKFDKRKTELLQQAKIKVEEEKKKKKKMEEEELEKVPIEGIPGELPHEATPEERAEIFDKTVEDLKKKGKLKDVYVKEHYRSKPKKKQSEKPEWAII